MRRSQTGFRPDQGRHAVRARRRKLGLERLEERALMAAAITEFPITTAASQPSGIVAGPDGNLWFTEVAANKIASINPSTGAVQEFPVPTPNAGPLEITAGPAGSNTLYFTESTAGQIGEYNISTGVFTETPLPPTTLGVPSPFGITLGPDGTIWFTDANTASEKIGQFVPISGGGGTITEVTLPQPTGDGVTEITTGPDGFLWFVESLGNRLGTFSPSTPSNISEFPIPTLASGPFGIASRAAGNLWFTEQTADQIGSFNPTGGVFSEFPVPTTGSTPRGITAGPDTSFWFTQPGANQIGRIDPTTNDFQEFAIPTASSSPNGITTGPDGSLWFTETDANQIGRLDPTQILQATGTTIAANQGAAFTGVVASFTSAALGAQASDFTATIDWGDGTTTAATGIAPDSLGTGFNVAGTHTYSAQGTFSVVVTITDNFNDTAAITSTANVAPPFVPPVVGPIPKVTGLVRTGIHGRPTQITLTFSTALNPTQANNALNYSIVGLGPNSAIDSAGQIAGGGANDQFIHVLTAVYNSTLNTVTLTTYEHLSLTQRYQITVHSGPPAATANGLTPDGIQNPFGTYMAGVDDTPGTDFVAVFRGAFIPPRAARLRHVRATVARHFGRHG